MNSTLLQLLIIFPFVVQGCAMFFDEFYYHHKRDLPKWERIGHPIDTLSVVTTISIPVFFTYSSFMIIIYTCFSIFSSILVTKDEFVHSKFCTPSENWLHAVLFVLHPMVFLSLGLIWFERDLQGITPYFSNLPNTNFLNLVLQSQFVFTIGFMFYQIIYWNFIRKETSV